MQRVLLILGIIGFFHYRNNFGHNRHQGDGGGYRYHCDIPNIEAVNESGKAEPECQPPNRKTLGLFVLPGFVIGRLLSHHNVLSDI
jgi:hypothetical protein